MTRINRRALTDAPQASLRPDGGFEPTRTVARRHADLLASGALADLRAAQDDLDDGRRPQR